MNSTTALAFGLVVVGLLVAILLVRVRELQAQYSLLTSAVFGELVARHDHSHVVDQELTTETTGISVPEGVVLRLSGACQNCREIMMEIEKSPDRLENAVAELATVGLNFSFVLSPTMTWKSVPDWANVARLPPELDESIPSPAVAFIDAAGAVERGDIVNSLRDVIHWVQTETHVSQHAG